MIKVTITGPSGSGKTLVSWLLFWNLRLCGVNVTRNNSPFEPNSADVSLVGCRDQLLHLNAYVEIEDRS